MIKIEVGKTAATSIVASRIDSLSQSLADRSQNLRKGAPDGQAGKSRAGEATDDHGSEEPEDVYEEQEGSQAEEPEEQDEEQEGSETMEPEDRYEEQEGSEAEEPEDQNAHADDDARDEEPEEPVARSPRRRSRLRPDLLSKSGI